LTEIYNKYHSQGLQIIDVPSNTFNQEPKTDAEVKDWVHSVYNFNGPILTKQPVNAVTVKGEKNQVPEIYRWLRLNSNCFDKSTGMAKAIEWNYAKFLISGDGQQVTYYSPTVTPNSLIATIEKMLAA